jgi:endonuclease/exonuclease/phosphatase family metal-dependent hydrolase
MDHIGVKARAESAKLVLQKIKELNTKTPVILTGDFNVDQHNESYALIDNSGILKDSYEITALCYAQNGTFNSFKPDNKTDARIDHIFVSHQFTVERYGILTDTYRLKNENPATGSAGGVAADTGSRPFSARTPSDHFPVMTQLKY